MISVIVPIYKAEKFLEKCVDSILKQTYADFELVLVDDGSPDNCPEICDEYAKLDSRVKVVHQKNAGEAAARNTGVNHSSGEYIAFVDSDDFVDEQYLEVLFNLMNKYDADYVSCQCRFLHQDGKITMHPGTPKATQEMIIDLETANYGEWYLSGGVWCRLYKKEIIEKYNLSFDPLYKIGCDFVFNMAYLSISKMSIATSQSLYTYVEIATSIMHTTNVDAGISGMYATEEGRKKVEFYTKLSDQINRTNVIRAVYYLNQPDVRVIITEEQKKCIKWFVKTHTKEYSLDFRMRLKLQELFPFAFRVLRKVFNYDVLKKYKC